jgi:hypothetical protein
MAAASGPNTANIVKGIYTASGIVFAKATEANLQVAKLINASADALTDIFTPVTLATGKILSAATNSPIVQGVNTDFENDFLQGDYMFYYTAGAQPVLLGKIANVDGPTQITLTANSPVGISATPTGGQLYSTYCGKTKTLIGTTEQIIMRIPVVTKAPGQIWLPNWNAYRITANELTSFNKASSVSMATYSQINDPSQSAVSPVSVQFTIKAIWEYPKITTGGNQYVFANQSLFPNYAYALLDPYGDSLTQSLPANTLYKMFANESFAENGILATVNYPVLFLTTSGY